MMSNDLVKRSIKVCSLPYVVGVTGHRCIAPEHEPRIMKQVQHALQGIQQQVRTLSKVKACTESKQLCLHIVSCLAEGADRLVAKEAMQLGYDLYAILPFPRASAVHTRDLAQDAQDASRKALCDFLAKAKDTLELESEYVGEELGHTDLAKEQRQAAYAKASYLMVERCNMLIAIWHGEEQILAGSTAQTIDRAISMNIPVVWIHANKDVPAMLHNKHKVNVGKYSV